jgi:hypothetical protein
LASNTNINKTKPIKNIIKINTIMSSVSNKAELIQIIKDWISVDNDIRNINKELRVRKESLKNISQNLMKTMKENEIDEFDIKGGKLMYSKTNVKKPITKKNLVTILSKYYNGDISQALEMNKFIMDNREDVVKETIKRSISENP